MLLAACEFNPLLRTVTLLALNTALRKNEIRTLHWNQVDLLKRTLTVGRAKTEAGGGRVIPLNTLVHVGLVRWAGRSPEAKPEHYVFPACENARLDCAKPHTANIDPPDRSLSWRSAWRRALKTTGLEIRFHDLRHTCVTKLAEGQASEQTIMAIAGHISRTMLEHFSHIRMAAKRSALEGITRPIGSSRANAGVNQNAYQVPNSPSEGPGKSLN